MADFIEVHRIPMSGGEPFLQLVNLDDVSAACGSAAGTTIALRRVPDMMGSNVFQVAETYDQLRLMIGAAQGGIPMDTGGGATDGKSGVNQHPTRVGGANSER